tara:strand:- start:1857 stop:3065 length:1209 start_codon:yes stop_codon:yes gene_type:complete
MTKLQNLGKAFFINGGAGRVVCAIPALEKYANIHRDDDPDFIIVSESWQELFQGSACLRDRVYTIDHRGLFEEKLKNRDIVTPEPYRLNAYFNQKCNLVQAFDILINELDHIPTGAESKVPALELNKIEQITGHNIVNEVREVTGKDKVVVFQPFGQSVQVEGKFIYDTSGRSFELINVVEIIEELKKDYGVIIMSQVEIPNWQEMGIAMPSNMNLMQWSGVINASDYFLGCDSVGQHLSVAVSKPSTVVLGATYPENISYVDVASHHIMDVGKTKRNYSPIRLTIDSAVDRGNEDTMILKKTQVEEVVRSIKDKIGVSKPSTKKDTPFNMKNLQQVPGGGSSGGISMDNKPKIPKITKSGQSITKKLLTPPKPVAGFNKTNTIKKKPIDELVEMEINKDKS